MASKIGIHSIRPNKVISFVAEAKLKGFSFKVVKAVDDTGVAIDTKKISPETITITRFVTAGDTMGGLQTWTAQDRINFAVQQMNYLDTRTQKKADILAATNYFEIVNEADPRGFYDYYGLALIELVNEANRRGIKLALPAFNAGTPEWDDIVKIRNTGLFRLMKQTGHILSIHEGVFGNDPINKGFGDVIPGAPVVAGAGSLCFRYRYLYSLLGDDERIPLVVSEFYAGGGYNLDPALVVERMKWYDNEIQKDPYVLAVLPFTIDPTPKWSGANYTYAYEAIINYMASVKDTPNPNPVPTPNPTPAPTVNTGIIGLHGRADGRMQPADFQVVSVAKIQAVKLLSTAAPEDVDSLRAINPNMFIAVRLFADLSNRIASPSDFVNWVKGDFNNFYNKGVRYFEVHNEPNIITEGLGKSWQNGDSFGKWFEAVCQQLWGLHPDVQLGFPGVSPGGDIQDLREDANKFLAEAGASVSSANWVGIHAYWVDNDGLAGIQSWVDSYAKYGKPLFITEFSNPTGIDKITKAEQYTKFYENIRGVKSAFSFVVSASSKDFQNEVWRNEDGSLTAIPTIIGNITMTTTLVGKLVKVNTALLNLRTGPGAGYPILTTLIGGSEFIVQEERNGWIRITTNGWSNESYFITV